MKCRRLCTHLSPLSTAILFIVFSARKALAQDDALQLKTWIWDVRDTVPFDIEWEWVGISREDASVSILLRDFRFKSIIEYLVQELSNATSYSWTPDIEFIMRSFTTLHPEIVDPALFYLEFDYKLGSVLANISSPDFQITRSNGSVYIFEETSPGPSTTASLTTSASKTSRTTVFLDGSTFPTGPVKTTPASTPNSPPDLFNFGFDGVNKMIDSGIKLRVGLGVGFGCLGLLILLSVLGWFLWYRRRKMLAEKREREIKLAQIKWDEDSAHLHGGKPELSADGMPMAPPKAELGESLSGSRELDGTATFHRPVGRYDGGNMQSMGNGPAGAFSELDGDSKPVEAPGAGLTEAPPRAL